MTIPECLDAIAKHSIDVHWRMMRLGQHWAVRTAYTDIPLCPLELLAMDGEVSLGTVLVQLNLPYADGKRFIDAADQVPGHDARLRRQILQAVGLEEVTP